MTTNAKLYHQDFYAWINLQIDLLRQNRVQELDRELLVEELEDMGKHHQNEFVSRLIVLIAHLLKWQYQPEHRSSSWRGSIIEQRVRIQRGIRFTPSLKSFFVEARSYALTNAIIKKSTC
jgi:hypothetical protein